jgi:tetratricopeptide (TPR) repeat protein/tRNA A-37 threonylcarbamoyl transferase component Bud32
VRKTTRRSRLGSYRLTLYLGEGSTGIVYRARSTRAAGEYALKRIRPDLVQEPRVVTSLLTEARICAHLDHPGIARIHELGQADGEYFLVMEYVEGQSLKELLARLAHLERRLPAGLACHLAAELARALGYAHARCDEQGRPLGIVHRDVNPSNIMVTRSGQVKLLDFGIASAAGHVRGDGAGTSTGIIKGTLGYLSPEQAQGWPLDARSDLFSLGVVLYQCLTGQRLFDSPNPLQALQLLSESDFPSPCPALRELDPEVERVVRNLLQRQREDRPASGDAVAEALEPLARRMGGDAAALARLVDDLPPTPTPGMNRNLPPGASGAGTQVLVSLRRHRYWTAFGALVLAAALLLPALWIASDGFRRGPAVDGSPGGPAAIASKRWFVVLGFRNLGGQAEAAWLSRALAIVVGGELGQGGRLTRVDDDEVERARKEMGIPDSHVLSAEMMARVRRRLNADLVVLGSYASESGSLRIDLRVQETARGETVARASAAGRETDLFAAAAGAADQLHRQADPGFAPAGAAHRLSRATLPGNLAAMRWYCEGLARLAAGQTPAARELLEKAAAADPEHALTHLALGQAWSLLGYGARARGAADRALARVRVAPLSPEQRLLVQARANRQANRFPEATAAYQQLIDRFPDRLEYGLELAETYRSVRGKLATLERLRSLPPPLRDDPRIDLALTEYSEDAADRRVQAALAARQKALARGAVLLAADAESAVELARSALRTHQRLGDWRNAAKSGNQIGACLNDQGDDLGALRMADANLTISERTGDRAQAVRFLNNGAFTLAKLGRRAEARAYSERALAIARDTENDEEVCEILSSLAQLDAEDGDLRGAISSAGKAIHETRQRCLEDLPEVLIAAAEYQLHAGALRAAARLNSDGLALARRRGRGSVVVDAMLNQVWQLQIADELKKARTLAMEAHDLASASGMLRHAFRTELALARLALEEGAPALAETTMRKLLERAQADPTVTDGRGATAARQLLASALVARGQIEAAGQEMDRTLALAPPHPPRWQQIEIDIDRARIEAAQGRTVVARKRLRDALRFCRSRGFYGLELQARLATLEIGLPAPARARLLRAAAARRGFTGIARRAAAFAAIGTGG